MQIKGVAKVYAGCVVNEKEALEEAACLYFIDAYNKAHGTHFEIKEHRDKPDFLAGDHSTSEMMGVEVTHLYYDSEEAKTLLGRSSLPLHPGKEKNFDHLAGRLNDLLIDKVKAGVAYDFGQKIFLLIRVACPIFTKSDFEMCSDWIDLHSGNPFAEVWLLFYSERTDTFSDLLQIQ